MAKQALGKGLGALQLLSVVFLNAVDFAIPSPILHLPSCGGRNSGTQQSGSHMGVNHSSNRPLNLLRGTIFL
jgi:hypothetical protein